jgi:peptidoglycan/xylan/chitin deacetylase (PgdA/CDA1 family)
LKNFSTFLDFENFEEYLQRVRKDLSLSKELIEKNLPIKVEAFAYPWGHYSENLLREVKKIYNYAFTVEKDIVQPQKVNSLLIPRVYAVKDIFTFLKHLLVYGTEKGYRWLKKRKREKVI